MIHRIQKLPLGKRLRVLEIGAGYGAVANQLHQILDIEKYTIVDLPESLYISNYYLGESIGREASFSVQEKVDHGLEFAMPNQLNLIDGEFDLIINTISFGEMDLKMVKEYLNFIQKSLSKQGYFYSLNTHGKAGVIKPSQYLLDKGSLYSMYHWIRRVPNGLFNRMHYELVQTCDNGVSIDSVVRDDVDRLGHLIVLGVFLPETDGTSCYVDGLKCFISGQNNKARSLLKEAKRVGLLGYASVVASIILCLTDWRMKFYLGKGDLYKQLDSEAPLLKEEVSKYLNFPGIVGFLKKTGPRGLEKRIKFWIRSELD